MPNTLKKNSFKISLNYLDLINIIIFLCILSTTISLFYSSITYTYGWDLDQFMYMGSRLLNGEVIFQKEFDDKFLPLQIIFSIPAFFKSHKIWLAISFIISSSVLYKNIRIYLNKIDNNKNKLFIRKYSLMFSYIHLFLAVTSQQSLLHINLISSELVLISICILLNINSLSNKNLLKILFCCILLSIATSIRPYFLLCAIFIGLWFSINLYQNRIKTEYLFKSIKKISLFTLTWLIIISFCLFIFNVFPYIILDLKENFVNGIKLNSIEYTKNNLFYTLFNQLFYLNEYLNLQIFLFSSFILPIILTKVIKKRYFNSLEIQNNLYFMGIIFPSLLTILFIKRHFFVHYNILFVPFISISAPISIYILLKNRTYFLEKISHKIILISFLIINFGFLIPTLNLYNPLILEFKNIVKREVPQKIIEARQVKELIDEDNGINSFLMTRNNHVHWYLDESRHGFPLASVLKNIATNKGDISKLKDDSSLKQSYFLFPSQSELCETFYNYGPDIIFVPPESFEESCLKNKKSNYELIKGTFAKNKAYKRRIK